MPEYLAPGVFVEETSYRPKSIEGVGTSVAAIVGPTRYGPIRGKPIVTTSYSEFVRTFGDAAPLVFGGKEQTNHTTLAARAFFENGGKQLYVKRVFENGNNFPAGQSLVSGSKSSADGHLTLRSRFPGAMGNFVIELVWREAEPIIKFVDIPAPVTDSRALLLAKIDSLDAFQTDPAIDAALYPLTIVGALATLMNTGRWRFDEEKSFVLDRNGDAVSFAGMSATRRELKPDVVTGMRLLVPKLSLPGGGALEDGAPVMLRIRSAALGQEARQVLATLSGFAGVDALHTRPQWIGTIDTTALTLDLKAAGNPGLAGDVSLDLLALGPALASGAALASRRRFDLLVRLPDPMDVAKKDVGSGEVVFSVPNVTTSKEGERSLAGLLPREPEGSAALLQPIAVELGTGAGTSLVDSLLALVERDPAKIGELRVPRDLIFLAGASDGARAPSNAEYTGEMDDQLGSTGLAALEDVEEISIVMSPAATELARGEHQAVVNTVQSHCERMRYRFGLVDSRKGQTLNEVREWRDEFSSSRLALYYPWVRAPKDGGGEQLLPPSGYMAGVYARTDVLRGVHKAPANEVVLGALGFEYEVNRFQQELLNPNGINCLRSFPGRGHRVWGGRTLTDDPEWKYVNVRRYFLYLERSIDRGTQWVVFEPNGEHLWANVRATVDGFLYNEWRNGRLLGGTPKSAYFVRCDRSTMTQNDLDNGRLVCEVGVAPLRPAEFVIFRIGQKTADA